MTRFMKLDLAGEKDPGLVGPPLLLHHSLDPAANEAGTTGHQHDHPFRHPAPAHGELPPGQLHSQHLPQNSWWATCCLAASPLPRRKNREQPSVVSCGHRSRSLLAPSSSLLDRRQFLLLLPGLRSGWDRLHTIHCHGCNKTHCCEDRHVHRYDGAGCIEASTNFCNVSSLPFQGRFQSQ